MMGEDGQHHGVLWAKDKSRGLNIGRMEESDGDGFKEGE